MQGLKLLIITILLRSKQFQKIKNQVSFQCLKALGFSDVSARWAILEANNIKIKKLANGVAIPTLYSVINGESDNETGQQNIADCIDIDKDVFFPNAVNQ